MEQIRLNKYLAMCGVCSRRDADKLIEQGKVTVNGKPASVGMTVTEEDAVKVGSKLLKGQSRKVVLAFYKPVGVICTEKDPHAEKKINDIVRYRERVTYAGRLDKDSEGLLLLSNDGNLIESMMRGANRHEKEYIVKTDREITADFIKKISEGIYLKELNVTTRECKAEKLGKFTARIILTQGLNRQIRRMCEACGYRVKALKRTRVMSITLENLKPGQYRVLNGDEMKKLYEECGLDMMIEK
jgi:23S rRNA pseudouridine2604 synthase